MFLLSRLVSRRSQLLASLVIFSLSSGVLGGILFYFDSIGPDVLEDITGEVPVDMYMSFSSSFYYQNETTLQDIMGVVAEEEEILAIEPVLLLEFNNWLVEGDWSRAWGYYIGVEPSFFDSLPNAVELLQDDISLDNDLCLIQARILVEDGLAIGDNYTASTTYYFEGEYFIKNATYEIVGTFNTDIYSFQYYPGEESVSNLYMITTQAGLAEPFNNTPADVYTGLRNELWIQFDHSVVYSEDPVRLLENIENRIEQRTLPYARVDSFSLVAAVHEYASWSASMRAITLAFSVPSIIMGIMTAVNMSKLLADERRRDVGTLKTRGSSGWQAFWWILSSGMVVAMLGAFGALLTGALAALASAAAVELLLFDLSLLSTFTMLLSYEAIAYVFLFSFVVGLGVSLPSSINAFLITPTEAHQSLEGRILEDREEMGSLGSDLVLLGISMLLLTPYLLGFGYYGMPISAYLALGIALIPILSIFILALSRIMARPTSQAKARTLEVLSKKGRRVGSHVLSRNVRLFKKSEALGAMFIALVFTSGVFSAVAASTGSMHVKHLLLFQTGAEIAVTVNSGLENVTLDLLDNITSVEGVASASAMLQTEGRAVYLNNDYGMNYLYNNSIDIFGFQADKWFASGFWLDYFTLENHPQVALERMSENLTNVMASFRPVLSYIQGGVTTYGNEITIEIEGPSWKNSTNCRIVDVLADSPSQMYQRTRFLTGHPDSGYFVVANIELLHSCLNTSRVSQFYIQLESDANHTEVALNLRNIAPYSFSSVEVAKERIDEAMSSRAGQSIFGAYTLNVMFSLIYLSGGVLIVSLIRFGRLRRQFSVMRAMGANTSSITYAVIVDSITGLLLSALAGIIIGLLLAQISLQLPLMYMGTGTAVSWNRLPVVLIVPFLLLGGITGTAVVFTLGMTYLVASRNLRRNIAQEIQYMD